MMQEARDAYVRAYEQSPTDFDVLNSLGNVEAHEGNVGPHANTCCC